MKESVMDFIMVPCGLLIMTAYHLWLLHRIIHHPLRHCRRPQCNQQALLDPCNDGGCEQEWSPGSPDPPQ
ncbi:unnamed protein product [Rhodiola kirilowii]